jgi:glycolate oxidase iron-sulfur subunit
MQANALHASLLLLRSLGYTVVIPSGQHCCGALATHQGNRALAADLTTKNQALFTDQVDTILSIASGCTAGSPLNLVDILTFLAEDSVCRALPWRVWSDTSVSLHLPCTLRNVLAADTKVIRLLQRIPGLEWNHLEGSCCGAAGDHLLRQRTQAVALRKPLLAQLQESQADCVLTTNIGCALHLAEGMQQLKQPIQVWHPVELLVRCLPIGP